jgi:hypothetical protein
VPRSGAGEIFSEGTVSLVNLWALGERAQRAARRRAARYRERAVTLMEMAEVEPTGRRRYQLLELATCYDELAAGLEPVPAG